MAVFSKLSAAVMVVGLGSTVMGQSLVPTQDIVLPSSQSATDPLKFLGANSPWFAGEFLRSGGWKETSVTDIT